MTINSPNYPYYYPNNADCMWTITATYGQLNLVFNKFTVQSDPTCSSDYLQISGPIKKYRRARICGFPVSATSHYMIHSLATENVVLNKSFSL